MVSPIDGLDLASVDAFSRLISCPIIMPFLLFFSSSSQEIQRVV